MMVTNSSFYLLFQCVEMLPQKMGAFQSLGINEHMKMLLNGWLTDLDSLISALGLVARVLHLHIGKTLMKILK